MLRKLLIALLILSMLLVSGCTQQEVSTGEQTEKPTVTKSMMEEQAVNEIEREMEQAIENITTEDIENALIK